MHGLLRVREFTQDDAHIFCRVEDIQAEVLGVLALMQEMYATFGLEYELELSTRPEGRMGTEEVWDAAEEALANALNAAGYSLLPEDTEPEAQRKYYRLNPGDGAFYGPKIDVHIRDRLGRSWQCGTIQVDFNLPERFDLRFPGTQERPVLIHRVVYGSIERFIGILIEHFKGAMPLWLHWEPIRLLPVKEEHVAYAEALAERLEASGLRVGMDARDETVRKRIKVAALKKVPYTVVIGDKEAAGEDLTVRVLGKKEAITIPERFLMSMCKKKIARRELGY